MLRPRRQAALAGGGIEVEQGVERLVSVSDCSLHGTISAKQHSCTPSCHNTHRPTNRVGAGDGVSGSLADPLCPNASDE